METRMSALAARKVVSELAEMSDETCARVAVLMPAYNPGNAINRAVESLVNNTYPCDIYIVDDGSETPVAQILDDFPRAQVIRLPQNMGVVKARNVGIAAILQRPYEFVACLDADDVSYPDRLARQVEFLDNHAEIGAVGTWARHVAEDDGRFLFIERAPESPGLVGQALNYNAAIINSTFMVRADVLKEIGFYSEQYPVAEDYELFRRIFQRFPIANIPVVLVDRHLSRKGLSLTRRRRQLWDRLHIQLLYFNVAEVDSWLGALKTVLLFFVPAALLTRIKGSRST
jgi:glycosyltransferase involved in cell wall biosynthesis